MNVLGTVPLWVLYLRNWISTNVYSSVTTHLYSIRSIFLTRKLPGNRYACSTGSLLVCVSSCVWFMTHICRLPTYLLVCVCDRSGCCACPGVWITAVLTTSGGLACLWKPQDYVFFVILWVNETTQAQIQTSFCQTWIWAMPALHTQKLQSLACLIKIKTIFKNIDYVILLNITENTIISW